MSHAEEPTHPAASPGDPAPRRHRAGRGSKRRRLWLWIPMGIVVLVVLGVGVWLGLRVLTVKTELEGAQAAVATVQGGGDASLALTLIGRHSTAAVQAANDPVWKFLEPAPFVGDNLRAVRLASESLKAISVGLAVPILDAFDDSQGGPILGRIVPIMQAAEPRVTQLSQSVSEIQRSTSLIPQVRAGIDQVAKVLTAAKPALSIIPRMLGGVGAKNYLLVAQSNAESVGLGGSAASQSLIRIDTTGKVRIVAQADSGDYLAKRVDVPVDKSAVELFNGAFVSRLNATVSRPDFPTAAQLLKAFWQRDIKDDVIDGVISIDPLALARVLRATGPITLSTGEKVTEDNAVRLFLSEVYNRMDGNPDAADAFFKEAASAIFAKVSGGQFDPKVMLGAVNEGIDAGSILFWSTDEEVQSVVAGMTLGGVLPTSNEDQTTMGVYFRDSSNGSKIDYYMKSTVAASATCSAEGRSDFTAKVTLKLDITQDAADALPSYVLGGALLSKEFRTEVFVYGPPGTKVSKVKLGANSVKLRRSDLVDLGRPVASFTTFEKPGESVTVTATFTAASGTYGALKVRTTPMVHATEITLRDERCVAG